MILGHLWRFLCIALLSAQLTTATAAMPLLSDYNHKAWSVLDGAPVDVMKFAQTSDGWLWMATPAGLWRYDGVRFERVDSVYGHPLKSNILIGLAATADGALLVGYQLGGVSVFRKGYTRTFSEADGLPGGIVFHLEPAPDGSVWIGARGGLARLLPAGDRIERLGGDVGLPKKGVFQILLAGDGTQWIATMESIYYRRPGETAFHQAWPRTLLYAMAEAPDGAIWACDPRRNYYRVQTTRPAHPGLPAPAFRGRGLRFDRDGVMWVLQNEGLERRLDLGPSSPAQRLTPQNGLSGTTPGAIFQDREGNLWLGTATGVDRLRPNRLKPVTPELQLEGPAILPGPDGSTWVGDIWNGLRSVDGNGVSRHIASGQIGATHWSADGVFWYAWNNQLLRRAADGTVTAFPLPEGFQNRLAHAIQSTRDGAVWVSFHGGGLFRMNKGVWTRDGGLAGLPREMTSSMTTDTQGAIWMAHADNSITLLSENEQGGPTLRRLDGGNGLGAGIVMQLYRDGNDIWVGGERGVFLYRDGRFQQLRGRNEETFRGVSGIVRLPDGELWLNGADGIYRVGAGALAAWRQDGRAAVDFERFDALDGLRGHAQQIPSNPSLLRTRDGHLWFTTDYTVAQIDPSHVRRNPLPPPVYLRSVEAGDQRFQVDDVRQLELPKGSKQFSVSFTALSLSIPERVRFRYRLLGLDDRWEEPHGRREAYYTNLPPGNYRFEVIAANEDGVWNTQGAALDIRIPPTFVQTPWFIVLLALGALLLVWGAYLLRVRVITRRMRDTFLTRMAERSRIARALHDTLLQSVQGLILSFQMYANKYAPGSQDRVRLEKTLEMAEQLLVDGRDQIMDLRAASSPDDLGPGLAQFGQWLAEHGRHTFSVQVRGTPVRLRPDVHEEVYAIAREALYNASRYSEAKNIRLELAYSPRQFSLSVRDDGRGLDDHTLNAGQRPGHWGLVGMRERAGCIAAKLAIVSRPAQGTEVSLVLQARNAYEPAQAAAR
ncbi:sensor histidine kinase [Duganella radicis]|nr:sensor histidine kinase [Duganella radicis]